MVVIAIISTMSATVVISFGSFSEKIKLQEVAGIVEDTLKRLEMEVFQKDHQKNRVKFESDYLVVESSEKENGLNLEYVGAGAEDCDAEEIGLKIDPNTNNPSNVAQMIKKDGHGNHLEIKSYNDTTTECFNFLKAKETEWNFELWTPTLSSKNIRLIHFNINRESDVEKIELAEGKDYILEISAPYATKALFKKEEEIQGLAELKFINQEGDEKKITLKK